jgi:hypothetical protein
VCEVQAGVPKHLDDFVAVVAKVGLEVSADGKDGVWRECAVVLQRMEGKADGEDEGGLEQTIKEETKRDRWTADAGEDCGVLELPEQGGELGVGLVDLAKAGGEIGEEGLSVTEH